MKTKVLCWLPESTYLNEDSKKLLIDNQIVPLLDSSYSTSIWVAQGKPEWALRYYGYETFPMSNANAYIDEPYTEKNQDVKIALNINPNVTIGETCTEYIQQLIDAGCKSITFTSYSFHLFRIFGLNIRLPFTSQLGTWKQLKKKYGNKFSHNWIMIDQERFFERLIKWSLENNHTIMLCAPDKYKDNPQWVKEHLQLFIEAYKAV